MCGDLNSRQHFDSFTQKVQPRGSSSLIELPGVNHEITEVLVVVNVGRDRCIVIVPLLLSDLAISVLVAKAGQEVNEHLIGSHLSALDLRVHTAVVDGRQVGCGDAAVAIGIKFKEGFVNEGLSALIGCSTDSEQELIVVHISVLVGVQVVNEEFCFALGHIDAHVLEAPVEFLFVELAVSIDGVHDSERATHATDGPDSTSHKGFFHLSEN